MSVIKLDKTHADAVKKLFLNKKYMGLSLEEFSKYPDAFNTSLYNIFCNNYLSDNTKNFHAFGYLEGEEVVAIISFFESTEEPAWYYTLYRSNGDNSKLRDVLDHVIQYNESQGRLKFYTLVNVKHSKILRKFHWSKLNNERYGYFEEFIVPAKCKCFYTNAWELLYKRFLIPADTVVRCNFLKQEYRLKIPLGGGL